MPGIVVRVTDKCIGCGTCLKNICFVKAIDLRDQQAVIGKECRGCGRCVSVCPQNAIEVLIDDVNYVNKSIQELEYIIEVV